MRRHVVLFRYETSTLLSNFKVGVHFRMQVRESGKNLLGIFEEFAVASARSYTYVCVYWIEK